MSRTHDPSTPNNSTLHYSLRDYWELARLAFRRQRSEEDYRTFQRYQAGLLFRYLKVWNISLDGERVLDLGSGIGGYSVQLLEQGADVYSVDLMLPTERIGNPVVGNGLSLPLADGSFDFVFCASLIEHVAEPERLIDEIARVLRPGGYCYLSFPPYFSPRGGHEYAPWHYLGERWALRISRGRNDVAPWVHDLYRLSDEPDSFAALYEDWGLYPLTIGKVRRLLDPSSLSVLDISTRYLSLNPVRWPLIGEILTWHVQFLLQKPEPESRCA